MNNIDQKNTGSSEKQGPRESGKFREGCMVSIWNQSGHLNILCFTCIYPVLSQCAKHCTRPWEGCGKKNKTSYLLSRPPSLMEETDP